MLRSFGLVLAKRFLRYLKEAVRGSGAWRDDECGDFASNLYGWQNFGGHMAFSDGTPEDGCPNATTTKIGTLLPKARAFALFALVADQGERALGTSLERLSKPLYDADCRFIERNALCSDSRRPVADSREAFAGACAKTTHRSTVLSFIGAQHIATEPFHARRMRYLRRRGRRRPQVIRNALVLSFDLRHDRILVPTFCGVSLAAKMREKMANTAPAIRQLAEFITDDDGVVYRPLESLFLHGPWHVGRVVLLGDAVHATTPHLGQGAGMAIEDSIVLADEISKATSPEEAFTAYRARRFDRCRFVVEKSLAICHGQIGKGPPVDNAAATREMFAVVAQPL